MSHDPALIEVGAPIPGGPQPGSPIQPERRTELRSDVEPIEPTPAEPEEGTHTATGVTRRFSEPGLARANRELNPDDPDLLSAALSVDSPIAAAARIFKSSGMELDPSYILTREEQDRLSVEIPESLKPDFLNYVSDAVSREHAEILLDQFKTEVRNEQVLAEAGMAGLSVRLFANLIDPVNLALAATTGGLAWATKAGRVARMLRTGALTAAEAAAIEGIVSSQAGTRDSSDVVLAALGGFLLGGAAGSIGRSTQMADAVSDSLARQDRAVVAEALDVAGLDSAGAARAATVTDPLVEADVARAFDIATDDVEKSAFGKVRYDAVGRLGQSDDPFVRDLSRALAEEAVGLENHGVVRFGASERAALTHRTIMAEFRRVTEPEYLNWLQEQGLGWTRRYRPATRNQFFQEVGRTVRAGGEHPSNAIRRAAAQTRQTLARYLDEIKAAGVQGFENIPQNPRYLPRIFNHARVRELVATYGESEVVRLIKTGLARVMDDMDDEVLQRISRAYLKKVRRMAVGMDAGLAHGVPLDDLEFLRSMLREADMDEGLIETTLHSVKKRTEKTSRVSRAKRRLDFDESATIRSKNPNTGLEDVIELSEIFENDAERLLFQYSRGMSGWIGLARQAGIKSPGDVQKLLNVVRSRGDELGRPQADVDADIARIEFLIKGVTGVPLESDPTSIFAKATRAARDINFSRIGAAFGFAQLAEIGALLGTAGFRNTLAHVPALRGLIKRSANGKLTDDLAAEIEDMLAPGVDRMLNMPSIRWEDHGIAAAERGLAGRADDALQVINRVVADVGGLNATTTIFQRMAARTIAQKIAGFAFGTGKLTQAQQRRLKGMGISDEMMTRISAQIKKHADTEPSTFTSGRRKLIRINHEAWDDAQALDTFTLAIHREARRVVQENDIGTSTPWLHSTLGKTMTQFRSFALTAWSKATLHNIHHHDFQAWMVLQMSMLFGGMAYVAQQSINVGDKEERKKRLAPEEIAKAAFQRAGVSSLVPMLIDTAATTAFRLDPIFAYGRSSGLATGFVQGNPTVDLVDKLASLTGLPAVAARPGVQFTQRDFRNIQGLLPVLGGLVGVRRVADALGENLPKSAKVD